MSKFFIQNLLILQNCHHPEIPYESYRNIYPKEVV
jgi:hypothetical protein